MLKKISAALIVASMLAAPAMAAESGKTAGKTAIKTETAAPVIKPVAATDSKLQVKPVVAVDSKLQVKPAVRNANARMGRHHHRHVRPHHRFHKKFGMHRTHKHSAFTSTVAHVKRG
jgi:redox-regulated HSP33 family molecular chaperone